MGERRYKLDLQFQTIELPPFNDVLVLSRKCPHGLKGLQGCIGILSPDMFELVDIDEGAVEAIIVSKKLLKKLSLEKVKDVLREHVFPSMNGGEMTRVDFSVKILIDNIEGKF